MAVTKGQGNPRWTKDETILALELYLEAEGKIPSKSDIRVQELSSLLRSFPFHAEYARSETFRNPDGVAFKLQNLRAVATGKGLNNTSKMDREVWEELGDDPESVRSLSRNIKAGLEILKADKLDSYDHASAIEGGVSYRVHLKRERNSDLRKKFLQKRKREGALSCELCGERATSIDAKYRDSVFEVHHLKPLGLTGETKTSFTDLALLCANCHRAIHSLMRLSPGHISLSQARDMMLLKG